MKEFKRKIAPHAFFSSVGGFGKEKSVNTFQCALRPAAFFRSYVLRCEAKALKNHTEITENGIYVSYFQ